MSGETIDLWGTLKTLESNGSSITNNSVVQATSTYSKTTDGSDFPNAEFVLGFTFSTAPTEGTVLVLCARPLDINGTNDAEVPEATRPTEYLGVFVVNNVTTLQSFRLFVDRLPRLASYYIYNSATGQTVSSGWTLTVQPHCFKVA